MTSLDQCIESATTAAYSLQNKEHRTRVRKEGRTFEKHFEEVWLCEQSGEAQEHYGMLVAAGGDGGDQRGVEGLVVDAEGEGGAGESQHKLLE